MSLSYIPALIKSHAFRYQSNFKLFKSIFSFDTSLTHEIFDYYDGYSPKDITELQYCRHSLFQTTTIDKEIDKDRLIEFSLDLIGTSFLLNNSQKVKFTKMAVLGCFMQYLITYETDNLELFKASKDYLTYIMMRKFSNQDLMIVFFRLVQSLCQKYNNILPTTETTLTPNIKVQLHQIYKQKLALMLVAFCCFYKTSDLDAVLSHIYTAYISIESTVEVIEKPEICPICLDNANTDRLMNCSHFICDDCKPKCYECPFCKIPIVNDIVCERQSLTTQYYVIPSNAQNLLIFCKK